MRRPLRWRADAGFWRPATLLALLSLCGLLPTGCRCSENSLGRGSKAPPVVVVDPEDNSHPDATDEREPNDSRDTAQPLEQDRPVRGTLQDGGDGGHADADWYAVQVQGDPQVMEVSVSGIADGDLQLEAFDASGKRLVRVNNNKEGGGEQLVNLAVEAGKILLRVRAVRGRSGKGAYRISYQLRAREEGEELEPNWKAELATPLRLDEEATGYLGWYTDTDWYRVALEGAPKGALLRLEFDGVDGVRAGVSLRGADGKPLQERWSGKGQPLTLTNIPLPVDADHLYAVVRCRYDTNVESRYSLRLLTVIPTGPTELEPNDSVAQATLLPLDQASLSAHVPDGGDRDVYMVRVTRPRAVQVEASPPLGVDVMLELLDAQGKPVLQVNRRGQRQPELLPVLWVTPPGAYLRVRATDRREASATTPYRIAARSVGPGPWEREPNDKPELATPWGESMPQIKGFLHDKGDVDHYRLKLSQPATLLARVPPGQPTRIDLLYAAGGAAGSTTVGAAGGDARLKAPAAGEYILRLVARGDPAAGDSGSGDQPLKEYVLLRENTTEEQ